MRIRGGEGREGGREGGMEMKSKKGKTFVIFTFVGGCFLSNICFWLWTEKKVPWLCCSASEFSFFVPIPYRLQGEVSRWCFGSRRATNIKAYGASL